MSLISNQKMLKIIIFSFSIFYFDSILNANSYIYVSATSEIEKAIKNISEFIKSEIEKANECGYSFLCQIKQNLYEIQVSNVQNAKLRKIWDGQVVYNYAILSLKTSLDALADLSNKIYKALENNNVTFIEEEKDFLEIKFYIYDKNNTRNYAYRFACELEKRVNDYIKNLLMLRDLKNFTINSFYLLSLGKTKEFKLPKNN